MEQWKHFIQPGLRTNVRRETLARPSSARLLRLFCYAIEAGKRSSPESIVANSSIRQVVLWGIGHTNSHILRKWRQAPISNVRLTCISEIAISTYSGMLPGVMAGQYPRHRMEIDLQRLCAAAGARMILGSVIGLDLARRVLLLDDQHLLPFDVLSIGIGSVPSPDGLMDGGEHIVAIKPMPTFLDRLELRLVEASHRVSPQPVRIAVVGGGAGGTEIALCLPLFLTRTLGKTPTKIALIHSGPRLEAGAYPRTNDLLQRRMVERGLVVYLGQPVFRVEMGSLTLCNRERIEADVVIWATGAVGPGILRELGLPTDDKGFLLTWPTLQSVADTSIFVVGDSGSIVDKPTPKAGVFAVRQGPILWENLRRLLQGDELKPYVPQQRFLKIMNTGDGRAIAEYRGLTLDSPWCLRFKDWLDTSFVEPYQSFA
jgi:selenide, water dikinase